MKLFKEYFQKSKIFLYPLLGIKKGAKYTPEETYVSWKGEYSIEDMQFVCYYKNKSTKAYQKFEEETIFTNEHFVDYHLIKPGHHIYVFDFEQYPQTWAAFTEGMYSHINEREKGVIMDFFEKKGVISDTVESYLHPEYYHDDYAKELRVDIELLQKVHETCSKPNLDQETCTFKRNYVSLSENSNKIN